MNTKVLDRIDPTWGQMHYLQSYSLGKRKRDLDFLPEDTVITSGLMRSNVNNFK